MSLLFGILALIFGVATFFAIFVGGSLLAGMLYDKLFIDILGLGKSADTITTILGFFTLCILFVVGAKAGFLVGSRFRR